MYRFHNLLALLALVSMAGLTTAARANDQAANANNQDRAGQQQTVTGTVQRISDNHQEIVIRDKNNRDIAVRIGKNSKIRVNDKEGQASDLKDGDLVTVTFRQVVRRVMTSQGGQANQFVAGRVQSVSADGTQLVVKDHRGQEHKFQVIQNAAVRVNGKNAKLSNLKEGDHVLVACSKRGESSEACEVISEGEGRGAGLVAGQVESVKNNQIVLKDQGGHEHTFQLSHEAQVRVNNQEGTASDLKQGNQAAIAFWRVATEINGQRGNK